MKFALVVFLATLSGCESNAWFFAAEAAGLTQVKDGGHAMLACGKDDSMLTSHYFTARNAQGNAISGAVCCGLMFKGCTVRF